MSDFTARIMAILDTQRAQTQLNAFQSANNQLNIQVKLTGANANLNNVLKGLQSQAKNAGSNAGAGFASSFNSSLGNINAKSIRTKIDTGAIESSIARVTSQYEKLGTTGHSKLSEIKNDIAELNNIQAALGNSSTDKDLISNYERFSQTLAKVKNNLTTVSAESKAVATSLQIKTLDNKMSTWLTKNSKASKEFGASIADLRQKLANLGANATVSDLKNIENQFKSIDVAAKQMNLTGKTFGDTFSSAFSSIANYVSVSTVLYQSINALNEMFDNVVAVDSAMTELKKVTNETAEAYNQFLSGAGSTAKEIGSTVTDVVNSTADFSRLGYNFQDAQELAKVANIYSVVGDEVDSIDTASSSVISTMAAFNVEANDAISIVDKFNEVGNNFAISSGGIGEALTRSASSMAAANNTLDETIALITAANTVVQNPDSVGTAFKTKFLRNCLYVQKCA